MYQEMAPLALNGYIIIKKGYLGILGNTHTLVYYPIVSSWKMEVYRVETLDMGKIPLTHWHQYNMKTQLYP